MSLRRSASRRAGLSAALAALLASTAAQAQTAPEAAAAPAAAAAPSADAMTNLIRLLVAKGTLTQADGDALLAQAQSEADKARMAAATPPPPPPPPAGAVRVARVPESVRQQIRDEIRGEIMAQAATEGWVTKDQAAPEWTRRIRMYGDVRVRAQGEFFADTNSNQILDFESMTASGLPIDLARLSSYQFINTRKDRNNLRYRARLGIEAHVVDGVTATIALGSGDDNSPISENASLGASFSKRPIFIDTADIVVKPFKWATLQFGRFETPFNTTPLLYDEDLRFDGVSASVKWAGLTGKDSALSLTGGAFPLDYGSSGFPNVAINKLAYPTKWLFAGEVRLKTPVGSGISIDASAAYHSYTNVQGRLSEPCNLDLGDFCSTDALQARFLRKGNTLFTLRNLVANSTGVYPQLFGLKFDYNILDLNLAVRAPISGDVGVKIAGDYLRNLGFKRSDICQGRFDTPEAFLIQPYNNYGSDGNTARNICTKTNPTSFIGGNIGWLANATIGHAKVYKKGSWSAFGEYRYLQSDAVLDAYTDSDLHLGGTNVKGYIIGAEYGVADRVSVRGRWFSGNEIAGEPLAIDVLQIDFMARF
ncbi:putative porin [Novosphingobium sp.]|uniref:putative porin n=1 Tax=Novosphingobium sp. TaxID=1874826 RepID=UPI00260A4C77|nr:putative porin [Novosphingobium sp.]